MTFLHPPTSSRPQNHGPSRPLKPRYSARAFGLTFLVLSVLTVVSFLAASRGQNGARIDYSTVSRRDVSSLGASDEECRLVHQAKDQCAFIKKHCPDDEPGFLAYLSLYYCDIPNAKPVGFIILVTWLGVLFSTIGIAASDFFCINLSTIATILGMSESMAGVTFLAFGNGSPDVFSTFAAMNTNSSSLAIGELMGAAGFITAVVAGSMALVRPFKVAKKSFIRDVGFFVVAASFSMGFLADGKLHLWECIAMVAFYIFYVCFVVVWHWWIGRRRKRREKEAAARGHFLAPGNEEIEVQEQYHDDEDNDTGSSRPAISRGPSQEDFAALESGIPRIEEPDDDDQEEARDRWMGELSSNMRLNRPGRSRRNTMTPIRPSLVGALEFQAVLKSLQKSRNIQTIPMHARRYSDDPTFTSAQQQDQMSTPSGPATRPPYEVTLNEDGASPEVQRLHPDTQINGNRTRAGSTNDASKLRIDPDFLQRHAPKSPGLLDISEDDDGSLKPPGSTTGSSPGGRSSPSLSLSIAPDSYFPENEEQDNPRSPIHLAPPLDHFQGPVRRLRSPSAGQGDSPQRSPGISPGVSPMTQTPKPKSRSRQSTLSLPRSPFPIYQEGVSPSNSRPPSLYLPPPSASLDSTPLLRGDDDMQDEKPLRWWPYKVVPSPTLLVTTLFPTLCHWGEKNWWEKFLGIIAAPSVFCLTVTLPVVEIDQDDDSEPEDALDQSLTLPASYDSHRRRSIAALESPILRAQHVRGDSRDPSHFSAAGMTGHANAATVAAEVEHRFHENTPSQSQPLVESPTGDAPPHPHTKPSSDTSKPWNRWLTMVQLFLSPVMVVLVIYTQYAPPEPPDTLGRVLIRPILIALLTSMICLIPLLLTTTPTSRPAVWRIVLSLAGFVVSIAWISTIAAQVVAVLKAFAIILNMSHAILGLTVFAVGNSLGDLVADITVARLGYPVMALSACFGGPMLNILLGIGLSGSWILIRGAERRHAKHPDKDLKFRTYEIEVGETLIVSGVTLLITLLGLLVAVPLNNWMMSRRIAWTLIAVWVIGTVVNVTLEVVGVGKAGSEG